MPLVDITISREWEPVPDHDVPAWEVGRYTAGPERVVITVENASATEDRRATMRAVEDLLLALMQRERAEAEAGAKAPEESKPDPGLLETLRVDVELGDVIGLEEFEECFTTALRNSVQAALAKAFSKGS